MKNSHVKDWVEDIQKASGMWVVFCPETNQFHLSPALAKLAGRHGVNGCAEQIKSATTARVKCFEGEIGNRRVVATAMTSRCSGCSKRCPAIIARVWLRKA